VECGTLHMHTYRTLEADSVPTTSNSSLSAGRDLEATKSLDPYATLLRPDL